MPAASTAARTCSAEPLRRRTRTNAAVPASAAPSAIRATHACPNDVPKTSRSGAHRSRPSRPDPTDCAAVAAAQTSVASTSPSDARSTARHTTRRGRSSGPSTSTRRPAPPITRSASARAAKRATACTEPSTPEPASASSACSTTPETSPSSSRTANANAPWIGWESSESTRQPTMYVPSARSAGSDAATSRSLGRSIFPIATCSAEASRTRSEPATVETCSSKRSSTRFGARSSDAPFGGDVETSVAWANAALGGRQRRGGDDGERDEPADGSCGLSGDGALSSVDLSSRQAAHGAPPPTDQRPEEGGPRVA